MPAFDPRFCCRRPESRAYSRRWIFDEPDIGVVKDIRVQSTGSSRLGFDQILRVAAPDGSSPDAGTECSTAEGDYSSEPSSIPSLTGKKSRKIVLTSAQAKDVSNTYP
jgi:hypothetical protein